MTRKIILIISMAFSFMILIAQNSPEEFIKKFEQKSKLERINDVYIPKDLNDAMNELDRLTNKKLALKLTESLEDTIASKLHFNLGRWMLINWSLDEGSRLAAYMKTRGLSFPDDMMDLLIRCWYRHLKKRPLNENELIQKYILKRRQDYLKKTKSIDTIHMEQKSR